MRRLYAACAPGLQDVLATELSQLGARGIEIAPGGVRFRGDMTLAMRACLWSRVALRILDEIGAGPADNPDMIYALTAQVDWRQYLHPSQTLAVHTSIADASQNQSRFATLRVKDAIVDRMREATGARPSVDKRQPDLPLKLVVQRGYGRLYRDLAGDSLHRRGWRPVQVRSPLNECLAAGLLLLTGWDRKTPLADPMCGSGTLLIEAAHLASDRAPGLRRRFAFQRWPDFDAPSWQALQREAEQRAEAGRSNIPSLQGADRHPSAIAIASQSAARAEVSEAIHFSECDITDFQPNPKPGLVVANPPYGKRIGQGDDLVRSWRALGDFLKAHASGGQAWVLSGEPKLSRHLRMRASLKVPVRNTSVDCRWLHYEVR